MMYLQEQTPRRTAALTWKMIRSVLRFSQIRRSFKTFALPPDHDYFRHTSNTWLFNAQEQHSNRYFEFNVSALIDEAIRAAQASSCVQFSKLRDEEENRLFEIKLDNGKELVAKLPYPVAGPAHFTTASEVATMQFMRELLELPIPQVLAWSSRSENTPVKSEFIIMEKPKGKCLSDAWDDLTPEETVNIVLEIIEVERRMTETHFHALGSLYYIKDIPDNDRSIRLSGYDAGDELYCIGPSVERRFWRNGRAELNINRGPWNGIPQYTQSVIDCEIAWLTKYAKPHQRDSPLFRSEAENNPETHIKLLNKYALVPFNPIEEFYGLRLWHPENLDGESILVAPIDGKHHITDIINWQGAHIDLLLFGQSVPDCLCPPSKYIPVKLIPGGQVCAKPDLPDNYHSLSKPQQVEAKKELKAVTRYDGYTLLMKELNPPLHAHRALEESVLFKTPLVWASYTWDFGTAIFEYALINTCIAWKTLISPHTECPISFSESEKAANKAAIDLWDREVDVWELCPEIGIEPDGMVQQDKLEETRRSMEVVREKYLQSLPECEREYARRRWPYQDGALSITAEVSRSPNLPATLTDTEIKS